MIKLEYMEKEDLSKIVEWNKNKSADYLLQWAGSSYEYPLTFKQIENYYFNYVKKENSNIFLYKILMSDTNKIIGTIELREIDKYNKIGKVCRFFIGEEECRGKGIGTEVLRQILKNGFEDFKFEKIMLGVFDFNHRAIGCYEKVGFIKEKLLKNLCKSSVDYWNLYEMSISKAHWKNKKI